MQLLAALIYSPDGCLHSLPLYFAGELPRLVSQLGEAKKLVTKLEHYMSQIDMNVICTSRAKDVFDSDRQSADAWKGLDYFFDVVIEIEPEDDRRRFARVEKSCFALIQELSRWPWSYRELADRFGTEALERGVTQIDLEESGSSETIHPRSRTENRMLHLMNLASTNAIHLNEEQTGVQNSSRTPSERCSLPPTVTRCHRSPDTRRSPGLSAIR